MSVRLSRSAYVRLRATTAQKWERSLHVGRRKFERASQLANPAMVVRSSSLPAGLARRARLLLLLEQADTSLRQAAQTVGLTPRHARKWVQRFHAHGFDGLKDQPRPGRSRSFPPAVALHLVKIARERPDE